MFKKIVLLAGLCLLGSSVYAAGPGITIDNQGTKDITINYQINGQDAPEATVTAGKEWRTSTPFNDKKEVYKIKDISLKECKFLPDVNYRTIYFEIDEKNHCTVKVHVPDDTMKK